MPQNCQRIEEKLEKLKNEAVIYLQLEHPNIARLFDVYEDHHEVGEVWMGCLVWDIHQVSESMEICKGTRAQTSR